MLLVNPTMPASVIEEQPPGRELWPQLPQGPAGGSARCCRAVPADGQWGRGGRRDPLRGTGTARKGTLRRGAPRVPAASGTGSDLGAVCPCLPPRAPCPGQPVLSPCFAISTDMAGDNCKPPSSLHWFNLNAGHPCWFLAGLSLICSSFLPSNIEQFPHLSHCSNKSVSC